MQIRKTGERTTVISACFRASPADLFAALTQPERQAHWMAGDGFTLASSTVDGRPGGGFRYVYARPSGRKIEVRGAYRSFDPPRGYAYTESYDFSPLTIEVEAKLAELGGETRFTQTLRYASPGERDADFEGVEASTREAFAGLARYLEGGAPAR